MGILRIGCDEHERSCDGNTQYGMTLINRYGSEWELSLEVSVVKRESKCRRFLEKRILEKLNCRI